MEQESELVKLGKLIDENTFGREEKNMLIDGVINIDFLKHGQIVHEIKKSDAFENAHIWQIKYYLYYLKQKGIPAQKGILHYPKQKMKKDIILDKPDIIEIETKILPQIKMILNLNKPPQKLHSKACKKCGYYELCEI